MAIKKVSGIDFKAFYADPQVWEANGKPGWYVDDFLIEVDGIKGGSMDDLHDRFGEQLEKLPDDAIIAIVSGYMGWQGRDEAPSGHETDLQRRFEQWQAGRTEITFVATLQVPKDDHEAIARIQKAFDEMGARVLRSDDASIAAKAPKP